MTESFDLIKWNTGGATESMEINQVGGKTMSPSSAGSITSLPATPATGNTGAAPQAAASDQYAPSAQLVQYMQLAQQQNEVRPDIVQAVQARLAAGNYATQASIEQTATALLHSAE